MRCTTAAPSPDRVRKVELLISNLLRFGVVTSLVVVSRENGLPDAVGLSAVEACIRSYRGRMRRYAGLDQLAIWYDAIHVEELLSHLEHAEARDVAEPPRAECRDAVGTPSRSDCRCKRNGLPEHGRSDSDHAAIRS